MEELSATFHRAYPTSNGGRQRREAQSGQVHVAHTVCFLLFFFAPFGADLHRPATKVSASGAQEEVHQECVVGRDSTWSKKKKEAGGGRRSYMTPLRPCKP